MTWETVSQLVRIAVYTVASFFLGSAVADGSMFQAALAGLLNVGAFMWWVAVEKNKPA
jgi:hypothetical protein